MMRRKLFLLILGVLWSIFFILLVSCREGQRNVGEASPESQLRLIVKSGADTDAILSGKRWYSNSGRFREDALLRYAVYGAE